MAKWTITIRWQLLKVHLGEAEAAFLGVSLHDRLHPQSELLAEIGWLSQE